jgi:hypothetical protein
MPNIHLIKNVHHGLVEYIACQLLEPDESITMEFNQEVTIEEIIVRSYHPESAPASVLYLLYPSSEQMVKLATIETLNYFLNTVQIESVTNQAGKRWYHLPARTKLILANKRSVEMHIDLVVIGRAA